MSLSSTNNDAGITNTNTNTNDFGSFLDSIPAILSDRIKENGNNAKDSDNDDDAKVHMIMGNEAGDADSIISAISFGYVQSLIASSSSSAESNGNVMEVPIVSVPRADMSLRRDVILLLDLAGIDVNNLLYIDDDTVKQHLLPDEETFHSSGNNLPSRTLTLVDHNRIRSSLSHLSSLVTEIVDHHEDEKSHQDNVSVESGKRSIAFENGHATVASTCTLVAERLFQSTTTTTLAAASSSSSTTIDGSLGLLLLGVILLDSINMLPAAGKGTPRDEEAMQLLLKHTNWKSFGELPTPSLLDATALKRIFPGGRGSVPDRTALFEALSGAKNDPQFWSGMSVLDCLRIDYKKFLVPSSSSAGEGNDPSSTTSVVSSIGLSSVLLDMDSLLSKDNFGEDLAAFVASSNVGVFGILAVHFRDGKPNRELLLSGSDATIVDSFASFLLNHPDAAFLEMVEREECSDDSSNNGTDLFVRIFRQGNGKGSRKQVAPVLLGHASALQSRL